MQKLLLVRFQSNVLRYLVIAIVCTQVSTLPKIKHGDHTQQTD